MEESFRVPGTPMQKVAPEYLRHYRQVLGLLALLVQKYKC
jgi:hypothetical protein